MNTLWMQTMNQQSDMGVAIGARAQDRRGRSKCPDVGVNRTRQTSHRPIKHCLEETQRLWISVIKSPEVESHRGSAVEHGQMNMSKWLTG